MVEVGGMDGMAERCGEVSEAGQVGENVRLVSKREYW